MTISSGGQPNRWLRCLLFLLEPVLIAVRHRSLIYRMVAREVEAAYRGTNLGLLWSLITALLLLMVYTFVFGIIFRTRWTPEGNTYEFAVILFAGLIVYNIFSQTVNRAPSLLLENSIYIKKVVFPLEILPWVSIGSALFTAATNFVVLLVFYLFIFGVPPLTALLYPLILLPLLLHAAGLGWLLAALGIYLRDIRQLVGVATMALMFLSPIFYPASAIPESFRYLLQINPLSFILDASKGVLFWGQMPDPLHFLLSLAGGMVVATLGLLWFEQTRRGFADVI